MIELNRNVENFNELINESANIVGKTGEVKQLNNRLETISKLASSLILSKRNQFLSEANQIYFPTNENN